MVLKVKTLWEGHKIWKNFTLVDVYLVNQLICQNKRENFFQFFVAFTEKLNFKLSAVARTENPGLTQRIKRIFTVHCFSQKIEKKFVCIFLILRGIMNSNNHHVKQQQKKIELIWVELSLRKIVNDSKASFV